MSADKANPPVASHDPDQPPTPPAPDALLIARNPTADTRLPYLLRLPVAGEPPLVLATAVDWPGTKDAFCFALDGWPEDAEVLSVVPVQSCRRAGKAVHLVLQRRQRRRSMFVWTQSKGRTLIFWRTQKTMSAARPGLKVPAARGLEAPLAIAVDIRERYGWRFAKHQATCTRRELPAGDYGVFRGDELVAVVERKAPADLAGAAIGGTLAFVLAELARLPYACIVIEGRLSDVLKGAADHTRPGWLLSVIAALQVAHPDVGWLFADTRDLAEDFAFRWLAAAQRADAERAAMAERQPRAVHESGGPYGASYGPPVAIQPPLRVHDRAGRLAEALAMADRGIVWTTAAYAAHFGITAATAWQDLTRLVAAGALVAEGSRRGRHYRRQEPATA